MKITVLANNFTNCALPSEHGLSLFVEFGEKKILVDTGLSDMFIRNAKKLGIDLSKVDYVFLSHRHFDHVDGMPSFDFSGQKVFVHKNFFNKFYKLKTDKYEFDGVKWGKDDLQGEFVFVHNDSFTQIDNCIYLSGTVPRPHSTPKNHYFKKIDDEYIADILDDEQVILFEQSDGLVVISGCTHFGIENLTVFIKDKFPNKKVKAFFAALHTAFYKDEEVDRILEHIANAKIYQKIYALHCTGEKAGRLIEEKLGGKLVSVGDIYEI